MCGISGLAARDFRQPVDETLLRRMNQSLVHRGPDGEGVHLEPGIGLGFRRLGIIDLETGDQPMGNEDASVVVVCNGEIYNYLELRDELVERGHRFRTTCDVEVIPHLYEEYGCEFLGHLRGMFALALWDARRKRLLLARDRCGIKPLVYATSREGLLFASEMKALLASGAFRGALDPDGLADLFTDGLLLPPQNLMRGVRTLLPAHYLIYEKGAVELHPYWDFRFPRRDEYERGRTESEWAEALLAKLRETTALHMRSDVEVGAMLSPGIDSSSVAALARESSNRSLATFSVGFDVPAFDELGQGTLATLDPRGLEPHTAICTAAHLALLPAAVWHRENPANSGVAIPRMILAEMAAERGCKVTLAGEGADEVLGGYPWYRRFKLRQYARWVPLALRRRLAERLFADSRPGLARVLGSSGRVSLAQYREFLRRGSTEDARYWLSDDLRQQLTRDGPALDPPLPAEFPHWDPFCQLQYIDSRSRLLTINHGVDTSAMAHSVEVRVPFLDHELIELCSGIPVGLKMKHLREKHILRKAMEGVLPREIVDRPKRGLGNPTSEWFRGELPEFVHDALSPAALKATGYFDVRAVEGFLKAHRAGEGEHSNQLLLVLSVQLWDQMFIQGIGRPSRVTQS